MKTLIKTLLLLLVCSTLTAQVPLYQNLPDADKEVISEQDWNKAVREYYQAGGEIGLSPIDRIKYDEKDVQIGRNGIGALTTSWGLDEMYKQVAMSRVLEDCGNYYFTLVTVDSGTDTNHSTFAGEWWLPSSNYSGDTQKHWHGTHVSGIMWQMVGRLARERKNVRMKDAQLLNSQGSGSLASAVTLAEKETAYFLPYVEKEEGVIFNNSWGYVGDPIPAFEAAVQKSTAAGMTWIGSAGNSGQITKGYPGSSKYFSSVASLDEDGKRSSFSTMNTSVDVAAPGRNINSTLPGNKEGKASGTSMSSPFISALAGLAYGKYGPILQGRNMNIYLDYICTDISPPGVDVQTGNGIPYVLTMLDTEPCDVPGLCDDTDDPTEDDPDEEEEEEQEEEEPDFTTTITYNLSGAQMYYRSTTQTSFRPMALDDVHVTVTGQGNADKVYYTQSLWDSKYFKSVRLVVPSSADWGYTNTAYWCGQFYEYASRNDKIGAQINNLQGTTKEGYNCLIDVFDKADAGSITSFVNTDGELVMSAMTEHGQVVAYFSTKNGFLRRLFGRKASV